MESRELAKQICEALADKKGEDIKILNISEVTVLADYFIIASGSNRNQVQAMADNVEETLGKLGHEPKQIEGYQSGNWMSLSISLIMKTVCSTIWNVSGVTAKA